MATGPTPRYEPVADWYIELSNTWDADPAMETLPADLSGRNVLDLACGYGRVARTLAARRATVTGVDLSATLIEHARAVEAQDPLGIRYLHGDATRLDWWDGLPFDGVVCGMALMDVDDLDGALTTAVRVLAHAGWFVFSILHPCFPGGEIGSVSALSSWPPAHGYQHEGWWTTEGAGVRGRVGAVHRTLSTYLNAVVRCGLRIEEVTEPVAPVPLFLVVRCTRMHSGP